MSRHSRSGGPDMIAAWFLLHMLVVTGGIVLLILAKRAGSVPAIMVGYVLLLGYLYYGGVRFLRAFEPSVRQQLAPLVSMVLLAVFLGVSLSVNYYARVQPDHAQPEIQNKDSAP